MSVRAVYSNRGIYRARLLTSPRRFTADTAPIEVARQADRTSDATFAARYIVLQSIGCAAVLWLWMANLAQKPFQGDNAFLCLTIVGIALLGLVCVFLRRWGDVQWLATNVVRLGLLGTVVGLIIAFSAATTGSAAADPNVVRPMITAVVNGMYVALYATLLGIAVNLWLKINLRLLGDIDG
jgi:MotA/TolQ/ExbB proton channel family